MAAFSTGWFITGQALFGILIGVFVGLSLSPIVSTVIGLLFAFVGGSLIVLIKGRSDAELAVIGKSIAALSLCMIGGALFGIYARDTGLLLFGKAAKQQAPKNMEMSISLEQLHEYGTNKDYSRALCLMVKAARQQGQFKELTQKNLLDLVDKKVSEHIIIAMLDDDYGCGFVVQATHNPAGYSQPGHGLYETERDPRRNPAKLRPMPGG